MCLFSFGPPESSLYILKKKKKHSLYISLPGEIIHKSVKIHIKFKPIL